MTPIEEIPTQIAVPAIIAAWACCLWVYRHEIRDWLGLGRKGKRDG